MRRERFFQFRFLRSSVNFSSELTVQLKALERLLFLRVTFASSPVAPLSLYSSKHPRGKTGTLPFPPSAMDATAARWVPPPGAEEEEQQAGQSTSSSSTAVAPPRLCFPNTLAGGAKVPFVPLKPGRVTWYACGPTVYDSAHMVS